MFVFRGCFFGRCSWEGVIWVVGERISFGMGEEVILGEVLIRDNFCFCCGWIIF